MAGELTQEVPPLPAPRGGCAYHVYCSQYNQGAAELVQEVTGMHQKVNVQLTQRFEDLISCERMLVYLTRLTWTQGTTSDAFAKEVHC